MLIRCFRMPIEEFEPNDCVKMRPSKNHSLATNNKNINISENYLIIIIFYINILNKYVVNHLLKPKITIIVNFLKSENNPW